MVPNSISAGWHPPDEVERLAAVHRYNILDTPPDGAFDRVVHLAARYFDVPIATVTIVDSDRIWFKAAHGLDVDQIDRELGLCASAILQPDPYIVTDAISDPRSLNNPLVRGELGVRFYAAAPIRTHDGYNLGTVNVIAGQPRVFSSEDAETLQTLADIVADELEVRLRARSTVEAERAQRDRAERLLDVLQSRLLPQRHIDIPFLDVETYYRAAADELAIGGDFIDVFDMDESRWALIIGDVRGKGPEAAAATGEIRAALRAIARVERDPRQVLVKLNEVVYRDEVRKDAASELFCTALLLLIDPTETAANVTAVNAGHPLPLVRRTDGAIKRVGEPGQLLGIFPTIDVSVATAKLEPGDMVLAYTDGAVEQRGLSIAVGERALGAALASAPTASSLSALAHVKEAIEDLHSTINDDIALILARVT